MEELSEEKEVKKLGRPFEKGDDPRRKGNGRKKGKSFKKLTKQALMVESDFENPITEELQRLTLKEQAVILLVRDATKPDEDPTVRHRALERILKIVEPPVERIDHTTKGEKIGGGLHDLPIEKQIAILKILEGDDATTENHG